MRSFQASEIQPGDAFVIMGEKWVVEKSELLPVGMQRKARRWTCVGPENKRGEFGRSYFTQRWDLEYELSLKMKKARQDAEKASIKAEDDFKTELKRVIWNALSLPSSGQIYDEAPAATFTAYGDRFDLTFNHAAAEMIVNGDPENLEKAFREIMDVTSEPPVA